MSENEVGAGEGTNMEEIDYCDGDIRVEFGVVEKYR